MSNTTDTHQVADADLDHARELVSTALTLYARRLDSAEPLDISPYEAALARDMASNVRGWTHTTRLRDFLQGVNH